MLKFGAVAGRLEHMIDQRMLQEGDKLPSIRKLAEQFQVNKSTVQRALSDLERRHLIYSVPKSGYYVVKSSQTAQPEAGGTIDFASSSPDASVFPYLDFQHCVNKAIDTYKQDLFIYGTPQGLPSLLHVIQKQLANDQVFARLENLFVVSGVQQALSILLALPFPNGKKTVLIEQPGYHLLIEHLNAYGIPAIGIRRTAQGIDLAALEHLFRTESIKFFYTMPRFHNPLGSSYSEEDKRRIAALALQYDVYIVEDDYLADMEQDRKADPVHACADKSHIIYLKSYSKIIFPGLRVGIAVIPDVLAEAFARYKLIQDIDTSMLSQGALEIYLKSSMFDRHWRTIRSSYAERSQALHAALAAQAAAHSDLFTFDASATFPLHTHIRLNERVPAAELITRLRKQGVWFEPMDKHYLPDFPRDNLLTINVSRVRTEQIAPGIDLLVKELRRLMK